MAENSKKTDPLSPGGRIKALLNLTLLDPPLILMTDHGWEFDGNDCPGLTSTRIGAVARNDSN